MILIADSGSSKTDWRIIDNNGNFSQAQSIGINPYYHDKEHINNSIEEGLSEFFDQNITAIHFYGAGCSTDSNRTIIENALKNYFPNANISINHDLLAAARSLCGHQQGIACILGTGSNSCLFDGNEIIENEKSLGYILGDEGSGNHIGRVFIRHYLKGTLPDQLLRKFEKRYELTPDRVMKHIYQEDKPVKFFAQFSKFVFQNISDGFLYTLVYNVFKEFLEKNVAQYSDFRSHKIHFTGSLAFYFGNILRKVGTDMGLSIGIISENPIAGLTLFHKDQLQNS